MVWTPTNRKNAVIDVNTLPAKCPHLLVIVRRGFRFPIDNHWRCTNSSMMYGPTSVPSTLRVFPG